MWDKFDSCMAKLQLLFNLNKELEPRVPRSMKFRNSFLFANTTKERVVQCSDDLMKRLIDALVTSVNSFFAESERGLLPVHSFIALKNFIWICLRAWIVCPLRSCWVFRIGKEFGDQDLEVLLDHFSQGNVWIIQRSAARKEYVVWKQRVVNFERNIAGLSESQAFMYVWNDVREKWRNIYPNLVQIVTRMMVVPLNTIDCERDFSFRKWLSFGRRSSTSLEILIWYWDWG